MPNRFEPRRWHADSCTDIQTTAGGEQDRSAASRSLCREELGQLREDAGKGLAPGHRLEHARLGGQQLPRPVPVIDVACGGHDAVDGRVVEQVGGRRLDPPPAAVGVGDAAFEVGAGPGFDRRVANSSASAATSSGWMRANTLTPLNVPAA